MPNVIVNADLETDYPTDGTILIPRDKWSKLLLVDRTFQKKVTDISVIFDGECPCPICESRN